MEVGLSIGCYIVFMYAYLDSALGLVSISVEGVKLSGSSQAGLPLTS